MKKFLLLLGMVTCLIGTAACGKADQVQESQLQIDEASLINYSDQVVNALNEIVTGGMQDQYASDAVISAGISSWESAMSDLGAYNGVTDHKVEIGSDEAIVEASVSGADHNAVVTLIINDQGSLSSITVNVERSMGELMLNAALNTLMGMGTVFIILILISLLIGCFKFIPQIQEMTPGKRADIWHDLIRGAGQIAQSLQLLRQRHRLLQRLLKKRKKPQMKS